MAILTTLAVAAKLADAAGLTDWVKEKLGSNVGESAATKIIDVAQIVTGQTNSADALSSISNNPNFAAEFKQQILSQAHELKLAQLADIQSARTMYDGKNAMADTIAKRVIDHNHLMVCFLIVCNGLVLAFVADKVVAVALGNLIGASIGALWQERQQVINFFFGSSLGSKLKTAASNDGK